MKNQVLVIYRIDEFHNMSRRVTIMLESDLDKKIRAWQAKKIQKSNTSYSFSKAVNDVLRKCI